MAAASDITGGPVKLDTGSWFEKFITSTVAKTPEERAEELEADDEAAECHDEVVAQVRCECVSICPYVQTC